MQGDASPGQTPFRIDLVALLAPGVHYSVAVIARLLFQPALAVLNNNLLIRKRWLRLIEGDSAQQRRRSATRDEILLYRDPESCIVTSMISQC